MRNKAQRKALRRREKVKKEGRVTTVNNRIKVKSKYALKKNKKIRDRLSDAFDS